MSNPDRKVNDVGGLDGGSLDLTEHANTLFEKRVDALVMLLVHPVRRRLQGRCAAPRGGEQFAEGLRRARLLCQMAARGT